MTNTNFTNSKKSSLVPFFLLPGAIYEQPEPEDLRRTLKVNKQLKEDHLVTLKVYKALKVIDPLLRTALYEMVTPIHQAQAPETRPSDHRADCLEVRAEISWISAANTVSYPIACKKII